MWRKDDGNPQASPEATHSPANAATSVRPGIAPLTPQGTSSRAAACVSQGIRIKGDVTGTEDLFIDGSIDGKITLLSSAVTVGPRGTVKAEINSRDLILRGLAEGKFTATERIQIWSTAKVNGELKSERISIEDGAEFRGRVETGRATTGKSSDSILQSKKAELSESVVVPATDAASGAASVGAN